MKLYTKSGDDGTTGLFGGTRVGKDHPRVDAYGTVDELNAAIGVAAASLDDGEDVHRRFRDILTAMQSRLFDIGADLATPTDSKHADRIARIDDAHVSEVEGWIDEVESGNEPMTHFVLPGGTPLAAHLHLARTICRRAERLVVVLDHSEPVTREAIVYLNRASDLLFAMARRANKEAGIADVPWIPAGQG